MALIADETKPPSFAGVVVYHDLGAHNLSKFLKSLYQLLVSKVVPKVLDVDVGKSLVLT